MIIETRRGKDILEGGETRIAFAVNTEGINTNGFAGIISKKYWPELACMGECGIGTVLTKTTPEGVTFYALVCYSLKFGWRNQTEVICECFDSIEEDEPVASVSIGFGFFESLNGAKFYQIKEGMEQSKKKIILY